MYYRWKISLDDATSMQRKLRSYRDKEYATVIGKKILSKKAKALGVQMCDFEIVPEIPPKEELKKYSDGYSIRRSEVRTQMKACLQKAKVDRPKNDEEYIKEHIMDQEWPNVGVTHSSSKGLGLVTGLRHTRKCIILFIIIYYIHVALSELATLVWWWGTRFAPLTLIFSHFRDGSMRLSRGSCHCQSWKGESRHIWR